MRERRLLAEVAELIGPPADTSRSRLLEVAVVLLVAFEIVAALR